MKVPKLRFKDDDGREFPEWQIFTVAEADIQIIDGDRGMNYPSGSDFSEDGYCLFLNAKNVTKSGFVFNETSFITKQKDELLRKGKLNKNDLVLTTRGTVGNIAYFDETIKHQNMRINSGMVIIRSRNQSLSPNYLYKYFNSPKFRKTIDQIAFGSAQPQLTVAEINKFVISFPVPKEQTKIANFLTAIDEKITQLTQKCDLLAQYKKGVMQQIFSQKLRFKDDGREFPEWKEKCLGDLCTTFKSGAGITSERIKDKEKYPVYGGNGLRGYTDTFTHDGFFLLIGRQGALCGNINRSYGKAYISEHAIAVNANETSDTSWLAYKLDYMHLNKLSESSAQPGLSVNKLIELRILVPTKKEQTKIANFLTAIDNKITQAQAQLDAVKRYKKGLLQQMFV